MDQFESQARPTHNMPCQKVRTWHVVPHTSRAMCTCQNIQRSQIKSQTQAAHRRNATHEEAVCISCAKHVFCYARTSKHKMIINQIAIPTCTWAQCKTRGRHLHQYQLPACQLSPTTAKPLTDWKEKKRTRRDCTFQRQFTEEQD